MTVPVSPRSTPSLPQILRNALKGLWRYGAALGLVAMATVAAEILYRTFDTTRLSMVFLAGILIAAVTLGANPAYFAAVIAFVIYNFYLVEPRFTLQFGSAEDVIVLIVFLAVAMLTGGLTGRLRDEARRNKSRAHTTGALYEASRELSDAGDEESVRIGIVGHIAEAARGQAVLWDHGRTWAAPNGAALPQGLLEEVAILVREDLLIEPWTVTRGAWRVRSVHADGASLGLAAWQTPIETRTADDGGQTEDDRLINVLVDLGAAAVMRARVGEAKSEMEALARTEQLRNALLSSISHDLRTPLAAILASASSLREFGERFTPAVRTDLVTTIQEEAERLNRFVANLLSMTRLESGALDFDHQTFDAVEVLNRVLARFEGTGRPITRDIASGALTITGDPILLEQALGNVLENAVRYSPPRAPIVIRAAQGEAAVILEVEDLGPGVPAADLERIFEKFYRSPGTAKTQGTGLGLSIARGLVEAMDGVIAAGPRLDGKGGLLVTLELSRSPEP